MRRQLIGLACVLLVVSRAEGHALFPGQQVVYTAGERGIATFQTANETNQAIEYQVELFDYDTWVPTRHAVASLDRIAIAPMRPEQGASGIRRFTVMVDLDGMRERTIRVCTKSVAKRGLLQATTTAFNTRVCSKLTIRRVG